MSTLNERLLQYLWNHQRSTFQYGYNDCGTFTCRWVDSELGTDYLRTLRNRCVRGGLVKYLQRVGSPGGYASIVKEFCGLDGTAGPGKLGDVALFRQPDERLTLGVQTIRLVHAPDSEGLAAFDSSRIVEHWSLECLRP